MNSSLPNGFGALPGTFVPELEIHLGQTLPHIEEGAVSRKAQRAETPRNLSLIVWARPWHFGPSGKFWTWVQISVSYIFSFHKLFFFFNSCFFVKCTYLFYSTHFEPNLCISVNCKKNCMPESDKENHQKKCWCALCRWTLLFFVPLWCPRNSFGID